MPQTTLRTCSRKKHIYVGRIVFVHKFKELRSPLKLTTLTQVKNLDIHLLYLQHSRHKEYKHNITGDVNYKRKAPGTHIAQYRGFYLFRCIEFIAKQMKHA